MSLTKRTTNGEFMRRFYQLEAERENLDWQWDLIERWVAPGRGRYFLEGLDQEYSIDFRHPELFDNVAVLAAQNLGASLHSSITNPATRWFNLRYRDDELNKRKPTADWLEECSDVCWLALQDSNFNLCAGEMYMDDVSFGTACMLHEEVDGPEDEFNGHMFRTAMLREMYFEEDWDGLPLSVYRRKAYTLAQLEDKFGKDQLPDALQDKVNDVEDSTTKYNVVQVIYQRYDKRDADVSGPLAHDERPYGCRYIYEVSRDAFESTGIGEETGYYEMPAYIVRWSKTAGSKFGHSPAINTLPDIRTLQKLVELILTAAEKVVDPPTLTESRGIVGDLDLTAGGITVVRNIEAIRPYESGGRFDVSQLQVEELRRRIERAFFVDQLELKESPAMTATEVNARMQLMQRLLGPSLSRLQSDFLDPLVQRTFWMMARKGALPESPPELDGMNADLDIEYIGSLPRSQRMDDIDATQQWVALIGGMAQFLPTILDNVDEDAVARQTADRLGVPAEMWRGEEEVEETRAQRAQQEQQTQQIATQGMAAEVENIQADTEATLREAV